MQNIFDVTTAPTRAGTLFWLALLTTLLNTSWFILVYVIPMQKKRFDERGVILPQPTKQIINLAWTLDGNWHILLPLSVAILWGGLILCRHVAPNPRVGILFTMLALLALLGSTAVLLLCWGVALLKFAEVTAR